MIEKPISNVLAFLQQHGEVYVIGGYLRDTYLGLKPKDIDLTTNIPFDTLKKLIPSLYATEQGEKLGIGRFQRNGVTFEISSYTENIKKEIRYKDFTINTLYHDGKELFNLENAKLDLDNRFIRPNDDFLEHCETHPQAYLRAIRFASKINGELDRGMFFLMKENKQIFHKNGENRIRQEGYEILHSAYPHVAINILHDLGFLPSKIHLKNAPLHFEVTDIPYILAFLSLHTDIETIESFARLFHMKEKHILDMHDILKLDDKHLPLHDPKRLRNIIKWQRYRYQLEPEKLQSFFETIKDSLKGDK